MSSNTLTTITEEDTAFLVGWLDHSMADLSARVLTEADGPITKFVDMVPDGEAILLIEHGHPYFFSGREDRCVTIVVRRAPDLWALLTYAKNKRWALDRVAAFQSLPDTPHSYPQTIEYVNGVAEWLLTTDIEQVREQLVGDLLKGRQKAHREAVKEAKARVERHRTDLAAAETRLAELRKVKVV